MTVIPKRRARRIRNTENTHGTQTDTREKENMNRIGADRISNIVCVARRTSRY